MDLSPIKLSPAYKDYLWGGNKLRTVFGKNAETDIIAESWELSTHPDGNSVVSSGQYKGKSLSEYIKENNCIGKKAEAFDFFPILIKLIDAKDNLSIQVHPSDEYALKNENSFGKTEMWYIVDCEEGAYLYFGLNREITKEEFKKRIENNTLLEVLNKVDVHKGDTFFIKSGTIHAIGKGILICEIQQNSNLTYRVYDYDRRDKFGNPRELHIEKAIEVSELKPPVIEASADKNTLASCKYFTVKKYEVESERAFEADPECFHSIMILDGNGNLTLGNTKLDFKKGDSIFIPAQKGTYTITGNCTVLQSYV